MNTVVKARHMEVTDAMRQHLEGKLGKLPRYYNNVLSTEAILDMEGGQALVEIVVTAPKKHTFPLLWSTAFAQLLVCAPLAATGTLLPATQPRHNQHLRIERPPTMLLHLEQLRVPENPPGHQRCRPRSKPTPHLRADTQQIAHLVMATLCRCPK